MPTAKKSTQTRSSGKKASATKKPAARKPASRATQKKGASRTKRQANPAFMKAVQPSPSLAAIVGDRPLPRTEITKRLWDYIKKAGLQDTTDKRKINADDKLREVFGGKKQVSMFEMTKLVNAHLS